jgi:hypothetical protein
MRNFNEQQRTGNLVLPSINRSENIKVRAISNILVGKKIDYSSTFRISASTSSKPFKQTILKPLYSRDTYSILRVKVCVY